MEHCRFLAGLILAVLLSQGKASLDGEDILDKGRKRNICTWIGLHVKVLLSASFTFKQSCQGEQGWDVVQGSDWETGSWL